LIVENIFSECCHCRLIIGFFSNDFFSCKMFAIAVAVTTPAGQQAMLFPSPLIYNSLLVSLPSMLLLPGLIGCLKTKIFFAALVTVLFQLLQLHCCLCLLLHRLIVVLLNFL